MKKNIEQAIRAIVRPPRMFYHLPGVPLVFDVEGKKFVRQPMRFENDRHQAIVGSLYHSPEMDPMNGGPCVVYLHGNASCQLEGQFLVPNFCSNGCFVFCFDFAGCGLSDGKYISLGYFEKADTECICHRLNEMFGIGPFVLWGRSMGAATSLLVDAPDLVVGKISDSSYTSVKSEVGSIAKSMGFPAAFVPSALWYLKKKVLKLANFDMSTISPVKSVAQISCPAVFGHAVDDKFVPFKHMRKLYDASINPEKFIMILEGGHNTVRSEDWLRLCISFAFERLNITPGDFKVFDKNAMMGVTYHFDSFEDLLNDKKE